MTPVSQNFLYRSMAVRMVRRERRSSSSFCRLTANFAIGTRAPVRMASTARATSSSTRVTPRSLFLPVFRRSALTALPSLLLGDHGHSLLIEGQALGRRVENGDVAEVERRRPGLLRPEGQLDEGSVAAHARAAPLPGQADDHRAPPHPDGRQDEHWCPILAEER